MYNEKEVFEGIQKFLDNSNKQIQLAYNVHRDILSVLPEDLRDIYYFRYLELGGTIGLNMKNYKIYEYHHERNESFRIIYPDDKLEEIKNSNINHNVDFKFISIPCSLLEVPVEEFSKFSENEWNNFKSAVIIASNGKDNDKNKRNIEIKW